MLGKRLQNFLLHI